MPPSLSLPHKGGGTGRGAPRILLRSRIGPRQPRHRRSSSIGQLGRAPTLRAAHEDVAPPQAGCTGELHATHFAGPRSGTHVTPGSTVMLRLPEPGWGSNACARAGDPVTVARTTTMASLLVSSSSPREGHSFAGHFWYVLRLLKSEPIEICFAAFAWMIRLVTDGCCPGWLEHCKWAE